MPGTSVLSGYDGLLLGLMEKRDLPKSFISVGREKSLVIITTPVSESYLSRIPFGARRIEIAIGAKSFTRLPCMEGIIT